MYPLDVVRPLPFLCYDSLVESSTVRHPSSLNKLKVKLFNLGCSFGREEYFCYVDRCTENMVLQWLSIWFLNTLYKNYISSCSKKIVNKNERAFQILNRMIRWQKPNYGVALGFFRLSYKPNIVDTWKLISVSILVEIWYFQFQFWFYKEDLIISHLCLVIFWLAMIPTVFTFQKCSRFLSNVSYFCFFLFQVHSYWSEYRSAKELWPPPFCVESWWGGRSNSFLEPYPLSARRSWYQEVSKRRSR